MLCVVFRMDGDEYGLDTRDVVEIVPLVNAKALPGAPAGVVGLINYHEAPIPLIDLTALATNRPACRRITTRIIIVRITPSGTANGRTADRLIGLMTELVDRTTRVDDRDLRPPGVSQPGAPYLGRVAARYNGILQIVDVNQLLPAELRDQLFDAAGRETPWT